MQVVIIQMMIIITGVKVVKHRIVAMLVGEVIRLIKAETVGMMEVIILAAFLELLIM